MSMDKAIFSMTGKRTSEWASFGVPGIGSCMEIKPGNIPSLERGRATLPLLSLFHSGAGRVEWVWLEAFRRLHTHIWPVCLETLSKSSQGNSFLGLRFLDKALSRVVCSGGCKSHKSSCSLEFKILLRKSTHDFRECECIFQTEVDWRHLFNVFY